MSMARGTAVGLLSIAAIVYGVAVVPVVLGGEPYLSVLGGQTGLTGVPGLLFGANAVAAAVPAIAITRGGRRTTALSGLVAWLVIAAILGFVVQPVVGAGIALTALVPLAIVWRELA